MNAFAAVGLVFLPFVVTFVIVTVLHRLTLDPKPKPEAKPEASIDLLKARARVST